MAQPTTAFGNKTLAQMRALVYAGIRRKSTDNLAGLATAEVNAYIAKWDAFFVDAARWNFQGFRKTKIVNHYARTKLDDDLETGDLTILLDDNSDIPSAGRISINRDEIDYSGKDSPTVGQSITISTATDALGFDVEHDEGEYVEFLTAAPSDFGKGGELWIMADGNSNGTKLKHMDWRENFWPPSGRYTFKDGYLYLPEGLTSGKMQLNYWKKGMKLSAETDNLQCPEKWDNIVRYGAIAECLMILKDYAAATKMFAMAGLPTENNPEPIGLLQHAIAQDAVQSDSLDEVFTPGVTFADLP